MTETQLVSGRRGKGWSQLQAASKLGVSQPYLSLLEKGERPLTEKLARKAAQVYGLSPIVLPLSMSQHALSFCQRG